MAPSYHSVDLVHLGADAPKTPSWRPWTVVGAMVLVGLAAALGPSQSSTVFAMTAPGPSLTSQPAVAHAQWSGPPQAVVNLPMDSQWMVEPVEVQQPHPASFVAGRSIPIFSSEAPSPQVWSPTPLLAAVSSVALLAALALLRWLRRESSAEVLDPLGQGNDYSRLAMQASSGFRDEVIEVDAVEQDTTPPPPPPRPAPAGRTNGQFGFSSSSTQSSSERQDLFNGIAPVYDVLNDALSLGQHRIWKLQTVDWSGAKSGDYCIDLCCGSGDLAQLLSLKAGTTGKIAALDFAADMLEKGRQRIDSPLNLPLKLIAAPIDWVQGDALRLPYADNTFDAATMGYGLRNVVSIPDALVEIRRVLKPGAKAAILDFNRPSNDLVAQFQRQYLDTLVVPAATMAGMQKEYEYIMPSLDAFPTGPEQEGLALEAGFVTATHHELAAGLMGCLVVKK